MEHHTMTTSEYPPHDATNTALELTNRFQSALQEFQAAHTLDEAQQAQSRQDLEPYITTIADAYVAGIFHDDSPQWVTYLNSSAYSATRISTVLASYQLADTNTLWLRDRAVRCANNLIQFAEEKTLNLHQQVHQCPHRTPPTP